MHHALADGVASANLLARAMDLRDVSPDERDEYDTCAMPSKAELLRAAGRDHIAQVAELPATGEGQRRGSHGCAAVPGGAASTPTWPRFQAAADFLNHVVSPARTFASATLSLAEVKETSKHLGVTFNDVVLATTAGGLRELLLRYDGQGGPAAGRVGAGQHRTLAGPGHAATRSAACRVAPVHIDDPLERVRLKVGGDAAPRRTTSYSARN